MTNRLELNWNLDGFVDEQRYYCSETPIDTVNLPTPKAVLTGDVRTYVDEINISAGKKKYLMVGSIKNGIEKLSDEIKSYSLTVQPSIWSDFALNLGDDSGKTWTAINGAAVSNGALTLVRSLNQRLEMPYSADFHFTNGEDVTIRCKVKVTSFSTDRRVLLTTRKDDPHPKNWGIYLLPTGEVVFFIWKGDGATQLAKTWSSVYTAGLEFELSLERKGMVWYLYINGNQVATTIAQSFNYVADTLAKLTVGSENNTKSSPDLTRDLDGTIRNLQIIKGQALGNGGATTPLI